AIILADVPEDAADLFRARGTAVDQALTGLRIAQDRGQRLVEIVRAGAGQLAQRRYAREVNDLPAQLLGLVLQRLVVGDVAQGSGQAGGRARADALGIDLHPDRIACLIADIELIFKRPAGADRIEDALFRDLGLPAGEATEEGLE